MKHGEWGGKRAGAGRKPSWRSGVCKTVKLPAVLLDEVMRYARELDAGQAPAERVILNEKQIQDGQGEMPGASLIRLIDEKQGLARRVRSLEEELAKARKKVQMKDAELAGLKARAHDAAGVLRDALLEHRKGLRKGVRVKDAESALIALGEADSIK